MKDINFMTEEVKPILTPKRDVSKEKNISIKAILILVGVLVFITASILSPKVYVKSLEIQSSLIQADINSDKYIEVKSLNGQINAMQTTLNLKNNVINTINNKEVQVLDIINYVQEATPKGLYINGIDYQDKSLSISGSVKDSTAVAEYIANLNRFNVFKEYTSNATVSYEKANILQIFKIDLTKTEQGE